MLILKLAVGEWVDLTLLDGTEIAVSLVQPHGLEHARIGFDAPRNVKILRRSLSNPSANTWSHE